METSKYLFYSNNIIFLLFFNPINLDYYDNVKLIGKHSLIITTSTFFKKPIIVIISNGN